MPSLNPLALTQHALFDLLQLLDCLANLDAEKRSFALIFKKGTKSLFSATESAAA